MVIASGTHTELQQEVHFLPGPYHSDIEGAELYSSLPYIKDRWNGADYSDLSHLWPGRDRTLLAHSRPQSDSSHSSHDSWGTSSMLNHSEDRFDPAAVQDYFQHVEMYRPHSGHGQASSLDYLAPQYELTQRPSMSESHPAWPETTGLHWGVPAGVSFLPHSPQEQLSSSHNVPLVGDLRTWPQVFHKNPSAAAPKRPTLACLFCRERKIGCIRPAEDDPNQTCKNRFCRGNPTRYALYSKKVEKCCWSLRAATRNLNGSPKALLIRRNIRLGTGGSSHHIGLVRKREKQTTKGRLAEHRRANILSLPRDCRRMVTVESKG
ncbi:hypothetical protein K438DRAFT_2091933 [Mycena galopus ATCC 62051]|nr:hypothetical protein K438DRAFT_2091933 [Mycena galopus ATCC 62051]